MGLAFAQLLVADDDIPAEARLALAEGRPADAGRILMRAFDLSCEETSALVERDIVEGCRMPIW